MIDYQRPVYWNDLFGPGPGRDSDSRLNTFIQISDKYPDDIYWQALADCYQSSDNVGRISRVALRQLFTANRTGREMLMNEDQKKFYHLLPETVTIYRGMTEKERRSGDYGIQLDP